MKGCLFPISNMHLQFVGLACVLQERGQFSVTLSYLFCKMSFHFLSFLSSSVGIVEQNDTNGKIALEWQFSYISDNITVVFFLAFFLSLSNAVLTLFFWSETIKV